MYFSVTKCSSSLICGNQGQEADAGRNKHFKTWAREAEALSDELLVQKLPRKGIKSLPFGEEGVMRSLEMFCSS